MGNDTRNEGDTMKTTQLTGGKVPGAQRIDSCCWLDGNDDHLIVEFWNFGGAIMRSVYNRRTTERTERFLPVRSEEYRRMLSYC